MNSRLAPFERPTHRTSTASSSMLPVKKAISSSTPRARTVLAATTVLFFCLIGPIAEAHSVAFRLGRFSPRMESALWTDNIVTFTVDEGDFDGFIGGVEVAIELSDYLDLAFGVETSSSTAFTMYRDFVRDDGTEIVQDLSLRTTPVTAGVRVLPLGKLHRVLPYVAGGAGFYFYEYREEGEFIDFSTFDIFGDFFIDRGLAYGGYIAAGAEVSLNRLAFLFGEYRRHWAQGTHGGDFRSFGRFDLTANEVSFGVNLRF